MTQTKINEAFIAQGYDPNWRPDMSSYPEEMRDQKLATFELETVIAAKNSKREYVDGNWKYFPVFRKIKDASKKTGFGLSFALSGRDVSASHVGSRLLFIDESDCEETARELTELYERAYLG